MRLRTLFMLQRSRGRQILRVLFPCLHFPARFPLPLPEPGQRVLVS